MYVWWAIAKCYFEYGHPRTLPDVALFDFLAGLPTIAWCNVPDVDTSQGHGPALGCISVSALNIGCRSARGCSAHMGVNSQPLKTERALLCRSDAILFECVVRW